MNTERDLYSSFMISQQLYVEQLSTLHPEPKFAYLTFNYSEYTTNAKEDVIIEKAVRHHNA